jgi:hypothetical protein
MASRLFPDRDRDVDGAPAGPARATAITKARGLLLANIIVPLRDATERDPGNSALWLELARWRRPLWRYQLIADPEDAIRVAEETLRASDRAGRLDPHNLAVQRSLFESLLLYRRHSSVLQSERIAAINKQIARIAEREPESEVPLRYRVVQMLLDRGDADGVETEITTLLRLNRAPNTPHGRLTPEQREDVIARALKVIRKPPQELLDEWTRQDP